MAQTAHGVEEGGGRVGSWQGGRSWMNSWQGELGPIVVEMGPSSLPRPSPWRLLIGSSWLIVRIRQPVAPYFFFLVATFLSTFFGRLLRNIAAQPLVAVPAPGVAPGRLRGSPWCDLGAGAGATVTAAAVNARLLAIYCKVGAADGLHDL